MEQQSDDLLFKFLEEDGYAIYATGFKWSLPHKCRDGSWEPGHWMPSVSGSLVACENGYHLCKSENILDWLGPTAYIAETDPYAWVIPNNNTTTGKVVAREARLLRECTKLTDNPGEIIYAILEHMFPIIEIHLPAHAHLFRLFAQCIRDHINIREKTKTHSTGTTWLDHYCDHYYDLLMATKELCVALDNVCGWSSVPTSAIDDLPYRETSYQIACMTANKTMSMCNCIYHPPSRDSEGYLLISDAGRFACDIYSRHTLGPVDVNAGREWSKTREALSDTVFLAEKARVSRIIASLLAEE